MVEKRHQSNFRSFLSFQLSYPVRPLVRVCRRGQRAGYRQKEQGSLPAHFKCRRLLSTSERALLSEGTKKNEGVVVSPCSSRSRKRTRAQ